MASLEELKRKLQKGSWSDRRDAAQALGQMKSQRNQVVPLLKLRFRTSLLRLTLFAYQLVIEHVLSEEHDWPGNNSCQRWVWSTIQRHKAPLWSSQRLSLQEGPHVVTDDE